MNLKMSKTEISDKIIKDLSLLSSLEVNVAPQICHAAYIFIRHGRESQSYKKILAQLTGTGNASQVDDCIAAVACVYVRACHANNVFNEIKEPSQLPEATITVLKDCFIQHKEELESVSDVYDGVAYRGLQWRLQTQIASRSQLTSTQPRALLRLQLSSGGECTNVDLTADMPNILHWSEMIEQALAEGRTQHARKVQRVVSS